MAGYIGNIPVPQATQTRDTFTATAGQTSFATSGYTPNYLDVYLNGVKLAASDYTATNGSDVVLAAGATLNDILDVVAYNTFEVNSGFHLGDNDKAIFGAGSDLQIYHDGSGSRIYENGTGILAFYSNGSGINFYKGEAAGNMLTLATDGAVTAYYNNSQKLATTSTGIDVTGTVTADGLTVDGNATINNNSAVFKIYETGGADLRLSVTGSNTYINSYLAKPLNLLTDNTVRLNINSGGDISFYEDTGTTPKFFWDASAEGLAVGKSSLNTWASNYRPLQIGESGSLYSRSDTTEVLGIGSNFHYDGTSNKYLINGYASRMYQNSGIFAFENAASGTAGNAITFTERMRIDSSGNLLVGSSSDSWTNTVGARLFGSIGTGIFTRDGANPLVVNRLTSDGSLVGFYKDGTTVGSISAWAGRLAIGTGDTGIQFNNVVDAIFPYNTSTQANGPDGTVDLGTSQFRFKDAYLSGGVYLGGTGSANLLDDYEEGTFTPYYSPQYGAFGSITYSEQAGAYTKIGDTVIFQIRLRTSSFSIGTASGSIYIHGMPFTSVNNSQWGRNSQSLYANNWGGDTPRATSVEVNTTYAYLFYRSVSNGGDLTIQAGDFSTGGASNQIWITGSYKVA